MKTGRKKVRGLGLCSGGLDSILAGRVLQEQGIEIEWISFETPFFSSEKAQKASRLYGIPLTIKDMTKEYLVMLKDPPAGYGKHMNPCMDCHALMFHLAGGIMREKGFDFLFSGEVLGQRPMSQTRQSLRYVEKHSGFDGYIIRPLSAKLLAESIPEKQGMLDREKLLDLTGRSRKPQISIAEKLGISEYPAPAGGCLLTDRGFSLRLKDLFDHQDVYHERDFHLLKAGRHLRLDPLMKAVVGRTEEDSNRIAKLYNSKTDMICSLVKIPGPVVLVPGGCESEDKRLLAATICASYSKVPKTIPVEVWIKTVDERKRVPVISLPTSVFQKWMI
ncbi:MAG: tRNA 4-thiouridine(8) synthase ThiI [Desulfobacteraceae bacterium]|nr:MAG: tRNA 4-thiouridine(8) synthase ThiI [Desulfobacteraceae bacterium]